MSWVKDAFVSKREKEICLMQFKLKNKIKWNLKSSNIGVHIKLLVENWDEMLIWLEKINYNSLTIFIPFTNSIFIDAEALGEILVYCLGISAKFFSYLRYW